MKTRTVLKTTVTALLLMVACSTISLAQCDKTVTLTSSKTDRLDESGNVERTKDEAVTVTITKTDITIVPGGEDHKMTGKITSQTCDWKVPFKDGKSVIKSTVTDDANEERHITVTIEGKDGKVTLVFVADEVSGKRIRLAADKFE